jgi:hypothetical protein
MQHAHSSTDRAGWLQDVNSFLVSAFCHLAAFIALGLLSVAASDGWRGVKLLVNMGEGLDSLAVDDALLEETVRLEVAEDPAAAMGPIAVDVSIPATADLATHEALSESAQSGGLDGLALGGSGEKDGAKGQVATEFFGIGGYGQSFVYVVDASDSMNERGKFDRARYELMQSIEQLSSDQRYFVIFYNDGAYPMDADEPVLATQKQVAQTFRWVSSLEADGGTNPLPALLFAISMRPDAIYFLSDGQFDPLTNQHVKVRNRSNNRLRTRQIPIHTIAFMDRMTEGLMRSIARNSGGEYRFVGQ